MDIVVVGAFAFGVVIGWHVYYINRYRPGPVGLSDLATLIGIIGGGAILALFEKGTALFGAYGIGLAVGFFLYFAVLVALVVKSKRYTVDWFIDGRRPKLGPEEEPGGDQRAMGLGERGRGGEKP